MRLNAEALAFYHQRAFYQDKPFTGVAFFLSGDFIEKSVEYHNGYFQCDYRNKWLSLDDSNYPMIDGAALDDPEGFEPILYKGNNFTGVFYEFYDFACVSESYIKDGFFLEEVDFFDDGTLSRYDGTFDRYNELVYWYADGSLKKVEVNDDLCRTDFNFDEKGRLQSAWLEGGDNAFSRLMVLKSMLKLPQFDSEDFFSQIYASDHLILGGDGMSDQFFYQLASSNGFFDTRKFNFVRTSLSPACLHELEKCHGLDKIVIRKQDGEWFAPLKHLKKTRPSCCLEFDGEELRLL